VKKSVHPITRLWQWGIALIVAIGLLGACPAMTGTVVPFFLVCLQVSIFLALVALTITAKVWQVLPAPLKWLLLFTLAERIAHRRKQADQQEAHMHAMPPIPIIRAREEQRYSSYEQPSTNYPDMLPPQ
jgi:hypothetical protein